MNKIKCDVCGRFISYEDLSTGRAICWMILPESDLSVETWETLCAKHNGREVQNEKFNT